MNHALLGTIITPNKKVFNLSPEIVDIIKIYTGEGCWRNGKYINIKKIPKNDYRYNVLKNRPVIKQIYHHDLDNPLKGCVWFKLDNGKFVLINVVAGRFWTGMYYIEGYFWEMYYNKERQLHLIR
jgi:hypothetical protein